MRCSGEPTQTGLREPLASGTGTVTMHLDLPAVTVAVNHMSDAYWLIDVYGFCRHGPNALDLMCVDTVTLPLILAEGDRLSDLSRPYLANSQMGKSPTTTFESR